MVKVAVTQQEPLWFDLAGTVNKTCRLMKEAASNGADLITFPEVWITGYPMWIWSRPLDPPLATHYIQNSLSYDSDHMRMICDSAREHAIAVVLGFSENDNNSLYISQCIISKTGEIVVKRRKMKPTHMERTLFGDSSGASLSNVADLEGVGKVGALSCWEYIQPLLKYHTMGLREQIHVAAWPPVYKFPGEKSKGLWSMTAEGTQTLSQTYAIESATFVLHCTAVVSQAGIDAHKVSESPLFGVGGGHSAVFGPDGRRLTERIPETQEGIVYVELSMDLIVAARHLVDAHGHYSRPDLLWLGVDRREKAHVRTQE